MSTRDSNFRHPAVAALGHRAGLVLAKSITAVRLHTACRAATTDVPAGTPVAVVARVREVLVAGIRSAAAGAFYDGTGSDAWTTTPDELARFQSADAQKWGRVIKAAGIEPE